MSPPVMVRRRWWAWEPRVRREVIDGSIDGGSFADGAFDAIGEHPAIGIGLVLLALVATVAVPFLLLAVELAALLVVTMGAVVVRVVLRRPWIVEARFRSSGAVCGRWAVDGFRDAGRAVEQLREVVAAGGALPPDGPYDPDDPPRTRRPLTDPLDDPSWPTTD